jgi:hypothetical protein
MDFSTSLLGPMPARDTALPVCRCTTAMRGDNACARKQSRTGRCGRRLHTYCPPFVCYVTSIVHTMAHTPAHSVPLVNVGYPVVSFCAMGACRRRTHSSQTAHLTHIHYHSPPVHLFSVTFPVRHFIAKRYSRHLWIMPTTHNYGLQIGQS